MKGCAVFYEAPGTVSERVCKVCGTVCKVERDQLGYTSWAGAMGGLKKPHDYFYCPHLKKDWHEKALALVEKIEDTPSERVAELMQQDLDELMAEHGCPPQS